MNQSLIEKKKEIIKAWEEMTGQLDHNFKLGKVFLNVTDFIFKFPTLPKSLL